MTRFTWAASLAGATIALGLLATAHAQQPSATPATPAAKATPATPPPKTEVKKTAKAPSPCQGLDQKACAAKAECTWIAASKRINGDGKDGKGVKAYCRLKPKTTAKATKAAPATPATPATPPKK